MKTAAMLKSSQSISIYASFIQVFQVEGEKQEVDGVQVPDPFLQAADEEGYENSLWACAGCEKKVPRFTRDGESGIILCHRG